MNLTFGKFLQYLWCCKTDFYFGLYYNYWHTHAIPTTKNWNPIVLNNKGWGNKFKNNCIAKMYPHVVQIKKKKEEEKNKKKKS